MTEDRARLLVIIDDIANAARERILDPKNVEKGDHWRELGWWKLLWMAVEEFWESACELCRPSTEERRLSEAGDELAIRAMMLDKAETEE